MLFIILIFKYCWIDKTCIKGDEILLSFVRRRYEMLGTLSVSYFLLPVMEMTIIFRIFQRCGPCLMFVISYLNLDMSVLEASDYNVVTHYLVK